MPSSARLALSFSASRGRAERAGLEHVAARLVDGFRAARSGRRCSRPRARPLRTAAGCRRNRSADRSPSRLRHCRPRRRGAGAPRRAGVSLAAPRARPLGRRDGVIGGRRRATEVHAGRDDEADPETEQHPEPARCGNRLSSTCGCGAPSASGILPERARGDQSSSGSTSSASRARRISAAPRRSTKRAAQQLVQRRALARCGTEAERDSAPPCAPSAAARARGSQPPRPRARLAIARTLFKQRVRGLALGRVGAPRSEVRIRRPAGLPPLRELERRERRVVVCEQAAQAADARDSGLDHDLARPVGAPRAAGHLQDRLREPLVAARVRAEQSLIRVQHADERHAREVVALREHLRADQDVGAAARDLVEHARRARPCGA